MNSAILAITISCFAAGGVLLAVVNRGASRDERRRRWLKYFVYAAIVHSVLITLALGREYFLGLVLLILVLGAREIVSAGARFASPDRAIFSLAILAVYALLAGALIWNVVNLPLQTFIFVYLVIASFDGFSEVSGRLLGRSKLAPTISPGKTIEGAVGGLGGAIVMAMLTGTYFGLPLPLSAILSCAIAAAGLLGDLAASWVKRRAHIKDFNTLLPGHGGVLDRFDSFIVAGALAGFFFHSAFAKELAG